MARRLHRVFLNLDNADDALLCGARRRLLTRRVSNVLGGRHFLRVLNRQCSRHFCLRQLFDRFLGPIERIERILVGWLLKRLITIVNKLLTRIVYAGVNNLNTTKLETNKIRITKTHLVFVVADACNNIMSKLSFSVKLKRKRLLVRHRCSETKATIILVYRILTATYLQINCVNKRCRLKTRRYLNRKASTYIAHAVVVALCHSTKLARSVLS